MKTTLRRVGDKASNRAPGAACSAARNTSRPMYGWRRPVCAAVVMPRTNAPEHERSSSPRRRTGRLMSAAHRRRRRPPFKRGRAAACSSARPYGGRAALLSTRGTSGGRAQQPVHTKSHRHRGRCVDAPANRRRRASAPRRMAAPRPWPVANRLPISKSAGAA